MKVPLCTTFILLLVLAGCRIEATAENGCDSKIISHILLTADFTLLNSSPEKMDRLLSGDYPASTDRSSIPGAVDISFTANNILLLMYDDNCDGAVDSSYEFLESFLGNDFDKLGLIQSRCDRVTYENSPAD